MIYDTGWECWSVCLTSTILQSIILGLMNSFGAMIPDLMDRFNVSLSTVTIVGSVADGMFQLISPLVALAANKIGLKWAALMGCSISVVSMLVCSLFNNYLVFVIMYGGLMGAGVGFVYLPSITSCAFFFKERRNLAMGIANSGSGIGSVLMPVAMALVSPIYGSVGVFIMLAVMFASIMPLIYFTLPSKATADERYLILVFVDSLCINIMRSSRSRVDAPKENTEKPPKEGNILLDPRIWLMGMALFFAGSAFVSIEYFEPKMSKDLLHVSDFESKLMLSLLGGFNFFGRILMGWGADMPWVNPMLAFGLGCIGSGLCTISYPFITSYFVEAGLVCLYGFFSGCFGCAVQLSAVEMFGTQRVNVATGIMLSFFGVGVFTILSTTSLLFDFLGQNYHVTMALLGFYHLLGAALSVAAYFCHKRKLKQSSPPDVTEIKT